MEQKLLYESSGIPEKMIDLIRLLAVILLILGSGAFVVSVNYYGNEKNTYIILGALALIGGLVLICAPTALMEKYEKVLLRIYDDHVEGRAYTPDKDFVLKYEEIYDVKKTTTFGWNILVIESEDCCYWVTVSDLDTPYRIINKKLDELEKVD